MADDDETPNVGEAGDHETGSVPGSAYPGPAPTDPTLPPPPPLDGSGGPLGLGDSRGPAGFGASASPAGLGASASPAGLGASASPAGFGASASPAGFGASASPAGFGASASPAGLGDSGGPIGSAYVPATGVAPPPPRLTRSGKPANLWFGIRRVWVVLIAIAVLLVAGVITTARIDLPYYAITPGLSQNVTNFIELPPSLVHDHPGSVYMTDVYLTPLTALNYPYFWLNSQADIEQSSNIVGDVPVAEYNTEGSIDMSDATQAAAYVALHKLGYDVGALPEGLQLYEIDPAAPSYQFLSVGEVVLAVDGHPVRTIQQLSPLITSKKPGSSISVTFRSYSDPLDGTPTTASIPLGEFRTQAGNLRCYPVGQGTRYPFSRIKGAPYPYPCLGVEIYQYYKLSKLPFHVAIDPGDIVGPSAGLAFTLGLMNELDPDSLTGGRQIAATGTMSLNGAVGPVGGLPQKTIAVENAGATVFFVPAGQNYKAALAKANSSLTVVPVTSFSQALQWLLSHGGKIGPPSTSTGTGR